MNTRLEEAIHYWPRVAPMLKPPRSKAAYRRTLKALDAVLDSGGADESNPLARLADYLGELVEEYETANMPIEEMPAREFLRALMDRYELTQGDLPEVGAQSVVSAVLNGKRELNARQISCLSRRFGLPADVFMP